MYALVIIAASLVSPDSQTATVVESIEPSHHAECVQAATLRSNTDTLAVCVSSDGASKLLKGCTLMRSAHVESVTGISEADDLAGYALESFEWAK
jgi:hypothetical protein